MAEDKGGRDEPEYELGKARIMRQKLPECYKYYSRSQNGLIIIFRRMQPPIVVMSETRQETYSTPTHGNMMQKQTLDSENLVV